MAEICPATGHVVEHVYGPRCQDHGVPWFSDCPDCHAQWSVGSAIRRARSTLLHNSPEDRPGPLKASPYCAQCGRPGSWLGRDDLIAWVRYQVQASEELAPAARVELMAVLDRLRMMKPTDEHAVPGWKRLYELAPKVYNASKPVRDALMSEAIKRALDGLLGG